MNNILQVAAGSVIGTEHVIRGMKNQDGYHIATSPRGAIVPVVCDGCSGNMDSSSRSQIGADYGSQFVANAIAQKADMFGNELPFQEDTVASLLERVRQDAVAYLRVMALSMGGSFTQTVSDCFLFTVVGGLVTPCGTALFSIGDGVFFLNGKMIELGPFPDNKPPYLAYGGLYDSELGADHPELTRFQINLVKPTEEIDSLLIGCDGVLNLIEVAERTIPGRQQLVGPISQFWTDDPYFATPELLERKLRAMNTESVKVNWGESRLIKEHGLLPDDTTLIGMRRIPSEEGA